MPVESKKMVDGNLSTAADSSCDDTAAFKSPSDLVPLQYLKDFYLCTATKEVPGLGSIPWTANTRAKINNGKLIFNFHTGLQYLQFLLLREDIIFSPIPMAVGIHPAGLIGGYGRTGSDGDVFDGSWYPDSLCSNYIEITHLDLECMEVSGNFEMHFKMFEQGQFDEYSERINFLNGKFTTRIFNN